MRVRWVAITAIVLMGGVISRSQAAVSFAGSGIGSETGSALSARASFDLSGSDLKVTLTNTATGDVINNPDILTGVFFRVSDTHQPSLSPLSANVVAQPGAAIFNWANGKVAPGSTSTTGFPNIGHEWAYDGSQAVPDSTGRQASMYGIAAAGYLNSQTFFPGGTNLSGPANSTAGIDWGLTSAGDRITGAETGEVAKVPLIHDSACFLLAGWGNRTIDEIYDVRFQYGTNLSETRLNAIPVPPPADPEPSTFGIIAAGLAPLGMALRRRRHA